MPYAWRDFTCSECGDATQRRAPAGAQVRCINCSISRSIASMRGLHTRSGEFYQRWADGMERAARQARQLADIGAEIDSIG